DLSSWPSRAGVACALPMALVLALARGYPLPPRLSASGSVRAFLGRLRGRAALARLAERTSRRIHGVLHLHDLRVSEADPALASRARARQLPAPGADERRAAASGLAAPAGPGVDRLRRADDPRDPCGHGDEARLLVFH